MSAVLVRAPRPADAAAIARVHVDAWRETYVGMVPEHFYDEAAFARRREWWTAVLARDPLPPRLVVADGPDGVVGFAQAGEARGPDAEKGFAPARELHLFTLYLLAAHHGSGAGQALLDAVLGDAPAQLWVADGNARAIRFYERNGFRADGVECPDPRIAGLVDIRMVR
jgi:ribosomal protein S18 acetylase RimI-like enzyme